MYHRQYFGKDNTLFNNRNENLGKSELLILERFGVGQSSEYSRCIFHFDVDILKKSWEKCEYGDLANVTHKLYFKISEIKSDNSCEDYLNEICLFRLGQEWVEGCGTSLDCGSCGAIATLGCLESTLPSNWFKASPSTIWEFQGALSTGTTTSVSCAYYDCDGDYLIFDVTDEVNNLITGSTENYGYCMAFPRETELSGNTYQYISLFSRETNTFYEPYLETECIDIVKDDRSDFYLDKLNRLYLYVGVDGEPTKLDETPIVNIYNEKNELQITLTGTCGGHGLYFVEFELSSTTINRCSMWQDEWTNLVIKGKNRPNVKMKFLLKEADEYYSFEQPTAYTEEYALGFRGIRRDEKIRRGDIKKIYVDARTPKNPTKKTAVQQLYYRIYIKENGNNQLDIIKWHPVNMGVCENWFLLDTSWMRPQNYFLDFKLVKNQTIKTYPEEIKFSII